MDLNHHILKGTTVKMGENLSGLSLGMRNALTSTIVVGLLAIMREIVKTNE